MVSFKTMGFSGCNLKLVLSVVVIFGVVVPLFIQIALIIQPGSTTHTIDEETYFESRRILYEDVDLKRLKIDALEQQITELNVIKLKALKLIDKLDRQRFTLQKDLILHSQEKDALQIEIKNLNKQVQKSKRESALHEQLRNQKIVTSKVIIGVPYKSKGHFDVGGNLIPLRKNKNNCTFLTCIDYSRCSSVKSFRFYTEMTDKSELLSLMKQSNGYTSKKNEACIEIYKIPVEDVNIEPTFNKLEQSDGNILVLLNSKLSSLEICNKMGDLQYNNLIIVYPVLCSSFRAGFDYILPTELPVHNKHLWKGLPAILPVKRKYLVSFTYIFSPKQSDRLTSLLLENLKKMPNGKDIIVSTKCSPSSKHCKTGWCMCEKNKETAKQSQYCIIPANKNNLYLFSNIIDVMATGCVPIILGDKELLPFSSTLDWKTASIFLTYQRLPELVFLLRSLPLEDFITLKRNVRFFYETYFSSQYNILKTIIANFQANIGLPPTLFENNKAKIIKTIENAGLAAVPSRIVTQFSHNISSISFNQHKLWNNYPGAINTIPVNPITMALPSEYQFTDEGKDSYSPIGDGKGGDGIAFARSLGGDYPVEQFTVLMLTYDRETILIEALQRLSGMKYLNKVVVVWNNPKDPSPDLNWPDIDVKIEV